MGGTTVCFSSFILFPGICYCLLLKAIYEDRKKRIFDGTWFRSLLHSDFRLQCRFLLKACVDTHCQLGLLFVQAFDNTPSFMLNLCS